MKKELEIYNRFTDLDFQDYTETIEKDLLFIKSLLDTIGERDTIATLEAMTA